MTIKTKIASVAVAAAMAFSASAASAATHVINLSPAGGSGSSNVTYAPGTGLTFSSPNVGVTFTDLFTFTLPRAGFLSILFSSQDTSAPRDNVNFTLNGAKITGPGYSGTVIPRLLPNGVNELAATTSPLSVAAGAYTVSFKGVTQSAGLYTAQFTYTVPEPAIWAMMIIGFGVVGSALRVRRRKVAFA